MAPRIPELERLERAVRGGRVAHTTFLDPDEAAAMAAQLRNSGISVSAEGGVTGARRRVLTAFPDHIPESTTSLMAIYVTGAESEGDLRAGLRAAGIAEDAIGDILSHQDGLSVVLLPEAREIALGLSMLAGRPVDVQEIDLERLARGRTRQTQIIVPSLRVDALGAKAFKVSRAYFAKGIAGGRVSLNGRAAGKASSAEAGDEIYAEGLGRFRVIEVQGETRKGNVKVFLEVEQG
jgi:RNA-binding protein YlmH